jgi:hypothetical protein
LQFFALVQKQGGLYSGIFCPILEFRNIPEYFVLSHAMTMLESHGIAGQIVCHVGNWGHFLSGFFAHVGGGNTIL